MAEQKKLDRSFLLKILKKNGIIKQDDELNTLSTIIIPETFEEINSWNDRKKIYRFTEIATNLFEDFKKLKNIELPNSIISIEWKVFKGCESLTKIKLSENLKNIGFSAFENCLGFNSKDNPLIIPSTVKYIGDNAFKNVPYIYFDGEADGKKSGWGEEVNLALEAKKEDNIKDIFASFIDDDESEEEAKAKAEEEAKAKAEEEARLKAEEEARLKAEEEAKVRAEEEARLKAEEEARRQEESRKQSKFDESMTVSFWKKLEDFVDEKVKNISYSEEIKQLRSEKIILEKEIRDKDGKLQANNISIESLKIQMQGLEASKESLTKQLEAKEKELFEANKKNADLAKELAEKKEENLKLDSDNKLLYSIKTNLERELYDKNEVIRMLKS